MMNNILFTKQTNKKNIYRKCSHIPGINIKGIHLTLSQLVNKTSPWFWMTLIG
jgi:hypothetical protein